jgi:hypothetical protein
VYSLAFISKAFTWLQVPTCLAFVALALICHYLTSTFSYWEERGVKFEKPYPVVGSMLPVMTLREHMIDHFHRMYLQHEDEPFVGFYQGRSPALLIRDPELVKNILVKDFAHFVDHGFKASEYYLIYSYSILQYLNLYKKIFIKDSKVSSLQTHLSTL